MADISGTSSADILDGTADADTIIALAGDDVVRGGDGDDALYGGDGNDRLSGGLGADILYGGAGIDFADYDSAAAGVTVSLSIVGVQNTIGAGVDTLIGIENIQGSAFNDVLTGDAGANVMQGGAGDDLLYGGGGNDRLSGGLGADLLDGGAGVDFADYDSAAAGVTVNLSIVGAQNTIGAGVDTLISIEYVQGSTFGDVLIGNAGLNVLQGSGGDDIIDGGLGDDLLYGGQGIDTVTYASASGAVTVNLFTQSATGAAGSDTLKMFENIIGSAFDDVLNGDAGANHIDGGAGADRITGGDGDDVIEAGAGGGDVINGGNGFDTISFATASGAITIDLSNIGVQDAGTIGPVTVTNVEGVIGSAFNDVLIGRDGSTDSLRGGEGDDILTGGSGVD